MSCSAITAVTDASNTADEMSQMTVTSANSPKRRASAQDEDPSDGVVNSSDVLAEVKLPAYTRKPVQDSSPLCLVS